MVVEVVDHFKALPIESRFFHEKTTNGRLEIVI
jgi:hypothetical protein